MFQDEAQGCVYFPSSWKTERSMKDTSAQTSEIITYEADVQTVHKQDAGVQTVVVEESHQVLVDQEASQDLINFLSRAYSDVSKQLKANTRSHAFDGYDVDWEEKTTAVSCTYVLCHAKLEGQLNVTGLSWNSTGSVIAAAYGRFDHEDWCTHKSCLCTWNIDKRTLNSSKADISVDLSSCLMSIAFHPKLPAVIAGGNFNGEILVWDTGREDETLLASSGLGDDSHREPVTKVTWIVDPASKGNKYQILSTSGDGKMLFWQLVPGSNHLKLVSGFILQTGSVPRSLRISRARRDAEMGVMSASFSHEDKSQFVIGSEAGGVFKCSVNSGAPPAANVNCSVPLRSPVTFAFTPHHGPVFSVHCSPYHRNLFLSCGTDTSIRLYSMLQSKPLLSMEPASGYLFRARWSPVRPLVFCVTTADGRLLIYDLKVNRINPVVSLEASASKNPVYSLEYNWHRRQLVATGDAEGCIRVWRLSDDLTTQGSRELDILTDIASAQTE